MNAKDLEPLCNLVLIKPDPIETMSKGGIAIVADERYEKANRSTGTIVSFGPSAWLDPALGGEPQVSAGHHVLYAKAGGKYFTLEESGAEVEYIIVNDKDVLAKIP